MKMLTVYPALAGSYTAGKENVCLSNAYAHNVSIFRELALLKEREMRGSLSTRALLSN